MSIIYMTRFVKGKVFWPYFSLSHISTSEFYVIHTYTWIKNNYSIMLMENFFLYGGVSLKNVFIKYRQPYYIAADWQRPRKQKEKIQCLIAIWAIFWDKGGMFIEDTTILFSKRKNTVIPRDLTLFKVVNLSITIKNCIVT